MKAKNHKLWLALGALTFSCLPSFPKTGSYPSSAETDILNGDSLSYYQEEADRNSLIRNSKVIFINGQGNLDADSDSVRSMLVKFYVDQFRNSHDPESPLFTFMSKDANLAMGIGGVGVVAGWFDWNGTIPGGEFNVYNIPIPKSPESMKNLGAAVSGTKLFFNIMGRNTAIGNIRGYIEASFNGYGHHDFILKKVWFQIHDFTIGRTNSTFSDPAAQPDVMDPAGANGKVNKTNILVRYMHTWKNRWTVAGSLEFPSSQITETTGLTKKVNDYTPDVAALGQYQWDRGLSHIRLAGILRKIPYRDLVNNRNKSVLGWGLQLSSIVKAGHYLTFYALGSVGEGMASYTGDLSNGQFDLLPYPDRAGKLYAPKTVSVTAGVKGQISNKLCSTVCLSTLRHFTKHNGNDGDFYKYGQYLSANVVYSFTPRIGLGVEYLAGKRMKYDGSHGNTNRALAVFTFAF